MSVVAEGGNEGGGEAERRGSRPRAVACVALPGERWSRKGTPVTHARIKEASFPPWFVGSTGKALRPPRVPHVGGVRQHWPVAGPQAVVRVAFV